MVSDQKLRQSRLVFYKDDLDRIDRILNRLTRLSEAKSVLLVDKEGHMITRAGAASSFNQDTISALVAGSFSATREMARLLGENEFSALYHQGERDNIQLSLVGNRTILTIIFDESTTLGLVRLYAAETVNQLEQLFDEIDANPERKMEAGEDLEGFGDSAQDTLDSFFDEN